MAGKKPAKPIAGKNTQVKLDPVLYGTEVKYVGTKISPAVCQSCGLSTVRGMLRLKANSLYCSIRCVSTTIAEENEDN